LTARVDQLLHTFRERDAVSDEARLFRDRLRERGFASTIFAVNADPGVAAEVETLGRRSLRADAVLYHHATVADLGVRAAAATGRTALLYHGITPSHLVRPYQPAFADLLEAGANVLRRIAPRFGQRFADSRFGADEFRSLTGCDAEVLPFCLDERRFAAAPGERPARASPGVGWLSVGRIAPNKGLLALVAAFAAYARIDAAATLTLVGGYTPSDPYYWAVRAAIDDGGVRGRVRLTGSVDDATLAGWYAASDVYVCLSEHEGFCVPLIEAMRFGLPIVAVARTAIVETLGPSGVLLDEPDPVAVAAVVAALGGDAALRGQVVAGQRRRFDAFRPELTIVAFDRAIDTLLAG